MLTQQGGLCAVCREPEISVNVKTGVVKRLAVDHDHETGQVRGLLCMKCNRGIGYLNDNPLITRAATTYLESYIVRK